MARGRRRNRVSNESLPRDPLTRLFDLSSPLSTRLMEPGPTGWLSDQSVSEPSPERGRFTSVPVRGRPVPAKRVSVRSAVVEQKTRLSAGVQECVQRGQRKEVLFAKGVAGSSGFRYKKTRSTRSC